MFVKLNVSTPSDSQGVDLVTEALVNTDNINFVQVTSRSAGEGNDEYQIVFQNSSIMLITEMPLDEIQTICNGK